MLLLTMLLACHENVVTVQNAEPEVSVVAPFDGAILPAEVPVTLVVRTSDDITPLEELQVTWTSDLDGMLAGTVEFADGEASTVVGEGLSVGDHVLTVAVYDERGASASDTVSVQAVPNEPPSVEILSPADGDNFVAEAPLQVVAYLQDDFDAPEDLTLDLSSSASGTVAFTSSLSGGTATLQVPGGLTDEDQTLTLEVFDTGGEHAQASVEVRASRNAAPQVALISPTSDQVYEQPSFWVEVQIVDEGTVDYSDHELIWTGLVDSPWLEITSHLPFHPAADGTVGTFLEFTCDPLGAKEPPNTFVFGVIVTDPEAARGDAETEVQLRCREG